MAEVQAETPQAPQPQQQQPSGLEKVYTDYKIDDEAQTFQPQTTQAPAPQQAPQVAPKPAFDPFDPRFPDHMERVARAAAEAQNQLHQIKGELTKHQRELHTERVNADIQKAVATLTEGNNLKPKMVEFALQAKAAEDPRFLKIWENRSKNPQAYSAALKALKGEFEAEFVVRQDPQLAENQRAVKAAQQQMATTKTSSPNDKWESMTPAERQAEVRRIIAQG